MMITNVKTLMRVKEILKHIDGYVANNIIDNDKIWNIAYHDHYDNIVFGIFENSRDVGQSSATLKYRAGKLVVSDLSGYKRSEIKPIQNILQERLDEQCELPLSTDDFIVAVTKELNIIRHSQKSVLDSLLRITVIDKKKEPDHPEEIIKIPDYTGEFYSSLTKNWESNNEVEIFNYLDGMKKAFTVTGATSLAAEVQFLIEINTIKYETYQDGIVSDILEEAA